MANNQRLRLCLLSCLRLWQRALLAWRPEWPTLRFGIPNKKSENQKSARRTASEHRSSTGRESANLLGMDYTAQRYRVQSNWRSRDVNAGYTRRNPWASKFLLADGLSDRPAPSVCLHVLQLPNATLGLKCPLGESKAVPSFGLKALGPFNTLSECNSVVEDRGSQAFPRDTSNVLVYKEQVSVRVLPNG